MKKLIALFVISIVSLNSFAMSSVTQLFNGSKEQPAIAFNQKQTEQIERVVHDYLINNPEVLIEAGRALQIKQKKQQEAATLAGIKKNKTALFNDPESPVVGNPNGTVTLVEFFDYQCAHCKAMQTTLSNLMRENKFLKVVFKPWPIFGENSEYAARAALAANLQGKYLAMHDALLKATNPITPETVIALAEKIGIDVEKLKKDIDTQKPKTSALFKRNGLLATQQLQLVGTPAFIITNEAQTGFYVIPGAAPQENLQQKISALNHPAKK